MTLTTIAIVFAYLFASRAFNILMGVFFWQCSEKEILKGSNLDPPHFYFWIGPLTAEVGVVVNLFCFIFYPLIWLAKVSIESRTKTEEKKNREIRIAEKKNTLAELKDEALEALVDKELEEVRSQLRRAQIQ